jgi:hypothetical protein
VLERIQAYQQGACASIREVQSPNSGPLVDHTNGYTRQGGCRLDCSQVRFREAAIAPSVLCMPAPNQHEVVSFDGYLRRLSGARFANRGFLLGHRIFSVGVNLLPQTFALL